MKTKPRILLLLWSILLFAATSVFAELNPNDLSGQYNCEGSSYTGTDTIRKTKGGAYNLQWNFSSGKHTGVGVSDGKVLASTWTSGGVTGVVLYRIEGNRLVGKYTAPTAKGETAEENLTYTGPAPGKGAFQGEEKFSKVTPQPNIPRKELASGMRVAAKYQSFYYAGTLGDSVGKDYLVKWDDGTKGDVACADILPISSGQIKVGSRVMAVWSKNGRMYDGTVTARKDGSFTVKWDDGSAPSDVAEDNIVLLPTAEDYESEIDLNEDRSAGLREQAPK